MPDTYHLAGIRRGTTTLKIYDERDNLRNTHCTRLHALLGELKPGGIASEMTVTKANELLPEDITGTG